MKLVIFDRDRRTKSLGVASKPWPSRSFTTKWRVLLGLDPLQKARWLSAFLWHITNFETQGVNCLHISNWWFQTLWKIVSWDDYSQQKKQKMFQTTNQVRFHLNVSWYQHVLTILIHWHVSPSPTCKRPRRSRGQPRRWWFHSHGGSPKMDGFERKFPL